MRNICRNFKNSNGRNDKMNQDETVGAKIDLLGGSKRLEKMP